MSPSLPRFSIGAVLSIGSFGALAAISGCTGDTGPAGPQGPPGPPGTPGTEQELEQGDDIPGLIVTILSLSGGTAGGGNFKVGDTVRVNYRLQKDDGTDWDIEELAAGKALLSGPTSNYQRVIGEQITVISNSTQETDGSYSYSFPTPLPATYMAPFFDSPSFGPEDGELAGQPLLDGTYTVGFTFGWNYTVDGALKHDTGNATFDFLIGAGGVLAPREVVKLDNCSRCHDNLRVHGEGRQDVKLCVLCHTAGAEDNNFLGATPGVSIDFRVLIHKLHSGKHLPSVLGVTTDPTGARIYGPPTPYVVANIDFSHVAFPAWPQGLVPLPRDQGYTALSSTNKATEDTIRKGPSNCAVCHGDPDGSGPLTAPAQGDFATTQPQRQSCGSCHDDINWGQPYTANGQTMGAQANNTNCNLCHASSGNPLAVADAHLHPLQDPSFDPGLNLTVTNLTEASPIIVNGAIDPGEKIRIRVRLQDDAGVDVDPATAAAPSLVISGPTSNYNLLLNTTVPTAALSGAQPFQINVPMKVDMEFAGHSGIGLESFTTEFTPHWHMSGATTTVLVRTGIGAATSLTTPTVVPQNYIDVGQGSLFARDDYVVVNPGALNEEVARVQYVEGNRLWFGSPYATNYKAGLQLVHTSGVVAVATVVSKTEGVDFSVDPALGRINELVEFGAGNAVLVSYTTDFVMPAVYPLAINDSTGLDASSGKWTGKPIVDGTYTLGMWTSRSVSLNLYGESNSYKISSESVNVDFLVGSAGAIEPYQLIASGSSCFNCHQELAFHGYGRRSYDSCVLCHGTAGSEDRPQYVAANAPATTGATVNFRTMLHKIHMGEHLVNAADYEIVGFGSGAYPNNFATANFAEVVFPAEPGGVQQCNKCHENDAWHQPAPREHPTDPFPSIKRWTPVCGACHDSSDAQAHIAIQTDGAGNESCGVCHAPDRSENVERAHKGY